MTTPTRIRVAVVAVAALALAGRCAADAPKPPAVNFSRQVRPILSDHCFACHGPDDKQRKAKLRLDTKEGTFGELPDGNRAVVPGKPDESELIARISSHDAEEVMPPAKTGKKLTAEQIALLRQWVEDGANWSEHWAFVAPTKPALPKVTDAGWVRNPIDRFVLARLEREKLRPAPEAERPALIRRVTLDLTGLPPSPEEVDAFVKDRSPDAYEKVVDRLLASPRHGEHMARLWLDAARYGDTHGLHLDNYREMWPYRDWVVRAFNANLPFDRFVTEQLAGDLLPNPTLDQVVATGFNRCNVTTSEGGSIDEECYVRNVVDRVDTTGEVFLGLTVGCCRCHDHKYDPIRSKDYYQLFAFFNNDESKALDGNATAPPPVVKVPTPEQAEKLAALGRKVAGLEKTIAEQAAKVADEDPAEAKEPEPLPRADYVWVDDDLPPGAKPSAEGGFNGPWRFVTGPDHPVYSGSKSSTRTAAGLGQHFFTDAKPGLLVGQGDKLFAYVYLDPKNPPKEVMLQWNTGDWKHRAYWGENLIEFGKDNSTERRKLGPLPEAGKWVRLEVDAARVGLTPGTVVTGWAFTQHGGTVFWDKAGITTRTPQGERAFHTLGSWLQAERSTGGAGLPKPLQEAVKLDGAKRTPAQQKELRDYYVAHACPRTRAQFEPLLKQLAAAEKEREQVEKQVPTTLVFKERADVRPAYLLKRGEYDRKGEKVERATPAFLPPLPAAAPRNRLGLARWLVDPKHPLTARVEVNRLWQQCFGTGLVKTAEDFGSQGEPPSHPELLDWLAVEFVEDGWDVRATLRRMVTSAAYRQSARLTTEKLTKDPQNRLLSRGPRHRLDAEVLRDQALSVSGLLVERLGGPGVKPPQPSGLWEAVGYLTSNTRNFTADTGHEKVHRRSLYTFWKRTAPPPQMVTFDAPSREACTVRRERTNTPLQALLMMNDVQYVECSRALAERALREGGPTPEARATAIFRRATARTPDAGEVAELVAAYRDNLAHYTRDVDGARKLIAVGETKPDAALDPSELASWTMVANLVLNLDEVINK
jgi:mono/diheme cytochrome c family protein